MQAPEWVLPVVGRLLPGSPECEQTECFAPRRAFGAPALPASRGSRRVRKGWPHYGDFGTRQMSTDEYAVIVTQTTRENPATRCLGDGASVVKSFDAPLRMNPISSRVDPADARTK